MYVRMYFLRAHIACALGKNTYNTYIIIYVTIFAKTTHMAHFMNSEINTPLNNDMYTEYVDVFSFLFRLSTLNLFGFSLLGMYV